MGSPALPERAEWCFERQEPSKCHGEGRGGRSRALEPQRRAGRSGAVLALAVVAGIAFEGRGTGVAAQWPICYDYKVSEPSLCPKRDINGLEDNAEAGNEPHCYHTELWAETSPPPSCRDTGCLLNRSSACCCGASSSVPGFISPNTLGSTDTVCTDSTFGTWYQNGGAAGSCPQCKQGVGVSNGIGGNVMETYGEGETRENSKAFDFQTFGHISDLDTKLEMCTTKVRTIWSKHEIAINIECDVKTLLKMERCGNCWRAICEFHNQLHWTNKLSTRAFFCMQDLFYRRMECYKNWYKKYCDCQQEVPTPTDWKANCVTDDFFQFQPDTGFYDMCTAAPRAASASVFLAILAAAFALVVSR